MQVSENKVVSIHYDLTDNQGESLDSSREREQPLDYLHGAGNIIPGLEQALEGKAEGDAMKVTIEPADAYGEPQEALIQQVPREMLSDIEGLQVGMQLQASSEQGQHTVVVREIKDDNVTIDANHPLAGVTLNFDVEVVAIRDASSEEIEHGHVHSA
jgi:FKBP-type peptidyl-prolyl cis-trans isomerase SlyD